ncbi:MAG: hypothetical protein R2724_01885 [Bryobacterales bacterium]
MAAPLAVVSGGVFAARFADFSTLDTLLFALAASLLAAWGLRAPRAGAGEAACLLGLFLAGAWLADAPEREPACALPSVLARMHVELEDPVRLRGWVLRPPESS